MSRARKKGGPVQVLARDQDKPFGIQVHAGYVYWTTLAGDTISRIAVTGGKAEILARDQNLPSALAIDGKRGLVLWLTEVTDDDDRVASVPLAGGETSVLAHVAGATGLATDGDYFYVASNGGGYVMQVPLPTGEGRLLVDNEVVGYDLALGTRHAWLSVEESGVGDSLVRVPLAGGPPETMARRLDAVFSLALAGDQIWWSTRETGCVYRIRVPSGWPELMASAQTQPRALTADATHMYWANAGKGTIVRLAH